MEIKPNKPKFWEWLGVEVGIWLDGEWYFGGCSEFGMSGSLNFSSILFSIEVFNVDTIA